MWNTILYQPLKEGHTKTILFFQLIVVGFGSKLLVISNQDELLDTGRE
jgi:hypothetical protein